MADNTAEPTPTEPTPTEPTPVEPEEPAGPTVPDLTRDELGVHARAIWDNTEVLTKAQIASMYGASDSLTKDEMVRTVVGRYLDTRPDQRTQEATA